jgi:hypothetical protein
MTDLIRTFWPIFVAFVAFLAWLVRLKSRSVENGKEIKHTWVQAGIDPLDAQVEHITYDDEGNATT